MECAQNLGVSSKKQPRLFFVINSAVVGGAEKHTFSLARGLAAFGYECIVFGLKRGDLIPEGVQFVQPTEARRSVYRCVKDLAELINSEQPNAVVAVNARPALIAFLARLLTRKQRPIAAIIHSTVPRNSKEKFMQLLYTRLYNRLDSMIFISDNQRCFWSKHGVRPRQEITIHNGIDLEHFTPRAKAEHRASMRAALHIGPEEFVIGCSAVLRAEKNHLQVIDAIARLRNKNIPAKALLVGDGPMRGEIERRSTALGITEHVRLTGLQQDVRPYISAFDVGVLCSVSTETLSLAALEIMAMGVPMIMSDIGGASEIVNSENGALFPVGDLGAFLEQLERFYSSTNIEKMSLAARHVVETRFDQRAMIDRYFQHLSAFP